MEASDVNISAARAFVSAELPGLSGVPAEVGPVRCSGCNQRAAVIRHVPRGAGDYGAAAECSCCGGRDDLWMNSYAAGLAAGMLIEAARRGDPRIAHEPPARRPLGPVPTSANTRI
jgi:hypothetical protein